MDGADCLCGSPEEVLDAPQILQLLSEDLGHGRLLRVDRKRGLAEQDDAATSGTRSVPRSRLRLSKFLHEVAVWIRKPCLWIRSQKDSPVRISDEVKDV